ncbi:MAG: DNA-processing protein DprA [Geminicoccaceae bacterium]|nr:DNA-processing protein DprA [Geminicoccaceae bacterium]
MSSSSREERLDWLRLARTGGVGPILFARLLQRYGSPARVLRDGARHLPEKVFARDRAALEMDTVEAAGGRLLMLEDEDYPAALRAIDDPPPVLGVLGDADLLHHSCLAVVGARNASGNGRRLARHLAKGCGAAGLTIVSGLARGIDTAAHEGGLEAPSCTIAVIASGLDVAYPAENAELMRRIAECGAVVSERPWGSPPAAKHFPRRNRIIAGLSQGVLVVEAAEKSGSLMTARLALEQGREVMAVPGSPLDARHKGTNRLLRDGAALIEDVADVLAALPDRKPVAPGPRAERPPPGPPPAPSVPSPNAGERPADEMAGRLEELLGAAPLSVDELIRQCHASPPLVQKALLDLELEGRLVRHPGNRVSLEMG